MESPHKSNAHREIAAASLASLAATLAAIRMHVDGAHEGTRTSSEEGSDRDDSSFDADGEQPLLMRRLMS